MSSGHWTMWPELAPKFGVCQPVRTFFLHRTQYKHLGKNYCQWKVCMRGFSPWPFALKDSDAYHPKTSMSLEIKQQQVYAHRFVTRCPVVRGQKSPLANVNHLVTLSHAIQRISGSRVHISESSRKRNESLIYWWWNSSRVKFVPVLLGYPWTTT